MGTRILLTIMSLALLVAGCAAPTAPQTGGSGSQPSASNSQSAPRRMTIAIRSDPKALSAKLNSAAGAGGAPGASEIEQMLNAGLAVETNAGVLHALLAEAVPSVENGLWRVLPDGRMETTWHIREGAQ